MNATQIDAFGAAIVLSVAVGVPILLLASARRRALVELTTCASCGYELAGLAAGSICPECGAQDRAWTTTRGIDRGLIRRFSRWLILACVAAVLFPPILHFGWACLYVLEGWSWDVARRTGLRTDDLPIAWMICGMPFMAAFSLGTLAARWLPVSKDRLLFAGLAAAAFAVQGIWMLDVWRGGAIDWGLAIRRSPIGGAAIAITAAGIVVHALALAGPIPPPPAGTTRGLTRARLRDP